MKRDRDEMIPLTEAAALAGGYHQAYFALLAGRVRGERRGRHWFIHRGDAKKLGRQRRRARAEAATTTRSTEAL